MGIKLGLGRRSNSGADLPTESEVPTTTGIMPGGHKVEGIEPDERASSNTQSTHTVSTHALSSLQAATRSRSISGARPSGGAIEMPTVGGIAPIPEDGAASPDTQSSRYGDVAHTSQMPRGELGHHLGAAENSQGNVDMSST
jgi:hypothetical protein